MRFREVACWEHSKVEKPSYPVIKAIITNVETKLSFEVDAKVDTGFSGYVSVDESVIKELALPRIGEITVFTATDTVKVELYPVLLRIPQLKFEETLVAIRTRRCLVGRGILTDQLWLLDNVKSRFCLLKST